MYVTVKMMGALRDIGGDLQSHAFGKFNSMSFIDIAKLH